MKNKTLILIIVSYIMAIISIGISCYKMGKVSGYIEGISKAEEIISYRK